jgi:hypothetical protein
VVKPRARDTRRLLWTLLALAALAGGTVPAQTPTGTPAPDLLRLSRNLPSDSKPLILHADEIATWVVGTHRVLLFKGQVLVEQGTVQARFQQGAAWADVAEYKRTGVWNVDVYAEGEVYLQDGPRTQRGSAAHFDLHTRGELRLQAQNSKVSQQPRPNDPVYLRGQQALWPNQSAAPAAPIQRTSGQDRTGPPLPGPPPGAAPGGSARPGPGPVPPAPPGPFPSGPPTPGGWPGPPAAPAPPPAPFPGGRGELPPHGGDTELGEGIRVASYTRPAAEPGPGAASGDTPGPPGDDTETAPAPRPLPGTPTQGPPRPAPGDEPPPPPPPPAPPRAFTIAPRTGAGFQSRLVTLPSGQQALVVIGGVILTVRNVGGKGGLLDIEADRLVLWTKGQSGPGATPFANIQSPDGEVGKDLEFYLAGHVELRQETAPPTPPPVAAVGGPTGPAPPGVTPYSPYLNDGTAGIGFNSAGAKTAKNQATHTLRCDELYYDVSRNVAVALSADLQIRQPGFADPIHFTGDEMIQVSPTLFEATRAESFSSRLPSDPGLLVYFTKATLEEKQVPMRGLLGRQVIDRVTGEPKTQRVDLITGEDVYPEIEHVPFFYLPYAKINANNPLGPLQSINAGYNVIYGFQGDVTLDVYQLLGLDPVPNTHWRLMLDDLSRRGQGLGTQYDYQTTDFFGLTSKGSGKVLAWGLDDNAYDILGGGRGEPPLEDHHPVWRGRVYWEQDVLELPRGFMVQSKLSVLSDRNFLEAYYEPEFDQDPNQETYLFIKQQQQNWMWSVLAQPDLTPWWTETEWLPRADGWLLGQSFFDRLTYNAHASAAFAHLRPASVYIDNLNMPVTPLEPTDQNISTGRADLWQTLSMPLTAGPFKIVPYGNLDLTYYTQDLEGTDVGRVYGGAGILASIPFSHLYPTVQSEWFNVNGLYHKLVASANYYIADTNVSHNDLPQLDRLNDNSTDQALREIKPYQPLVNPDKGAILAFSPLYDPQLYAIRRLVWTATDTLDRIDELQLDLRQRLQTKRGYPGEEHIVDWMTLDVSASYFPQANRDDFGQEWAFLQYNYVWNIGDRNALVSTAWVDPVQNGAKVFTIGGYLDRPDRTSLFLGYRQIEPVHSEEVTASFTYVFSPKYEMTASAVYDFGTGESLSNELILTRKGSDLQVSFGVTYNALQNNFGVVFEILPVAVGNLAGRALAAAGPGGFGH